MWDFLEFMERVKFSEILISIFGHIFAYIIRKKSGKFCRDLLEGAVLFLKIQECFVPGSMFQSCLVKKVG